MMEKHSIYGGMAYRRISSAVLLSFLLFLFVLGFDYYYASTTPTNRAVALVGNSSAHENRGYQEFFAGKTESDPCAGRYIYIQDLPSRFNSDILENCGSLTRWFDFCPYLVSYCLGPPVANRGGILSNGSWFETNQFLLEPIFHERMKKYECLTNDSSSASAIFFPFYAGLDVGRYLWFSNMSVRDSLAVEAADWLRRSSAWRRMWWKDHFLVGGRPAYDIRRLSDDKSDWGSKMMFLREFKNTTLLTIEATSWSNDFGIPYPTYFHPSSDGEILEWQNQVRNQSRRYLFSFTGARRPGMNNSIRNEVTEQCLAAEEKCRFLDFKSEGGEKKCEDPVELIGIFRSSVFCLQPPGDSYTRRSIFDSVLAGCIPVFFHPYSFYVQYVWYLPMNYSQYSVYIRGAAVKEGRVSIESVLSRFSTEEIIAMREEVVRLIPKMIYRNPRSKSKIEEDAFDVAVRNVLERVETIRREVEGGRDPSVDHAPQDSWDMKLEELVGEKKWGQLL